MIRLILLGLIVAVAVFLGYVALQPATYAVTRQAKIAAPPPSVFPYINNLKNFDRWSPWANRDPKMQKSFSGPDTGVGATYEWKGDSSVGAGKMSIIAMRPDEHVGIRIDFTEPMPGASDVAFDLKPDSAETNVTWSIKGESGFIARAFMTAMGIDVEKMIGEDYEKGLVNLKTLVESKPAG